MIFAEINIYKTKGVMQLIMKNREFPRKILVKKAISSRLHSGHPLKSIIDVEIAQDFAGYRGEQKMDFHLKTLPDKDFHIYNDLYLSDGNPFQLDSFLVNRCFLLILDSKSIDGLSTIESQFNQAIQENNGKTRRVKNPITQMKRQSFLLMEWLQKRNIYSVPIEALVVNTNPAGIIRTDDPLLAEKVLNAELLPTRIETLQKKYQKTILNSNEMKNLNKLLLEDLREPLFDVTKIISPGDIQKGIHCPTCGQIGMVRKNRYWLCLICGTKSTTAHIPAIHHFFLLIKPTITVSECCDFLLLNSPDVGKRLLQSMNLPYIGSNKGRVYIAPWYKEGKMSTIIMKF